MAVYEHTLVCRCLKVNFLVTEKKSVDRNHGSRSELPGEGVGIPRGGRYFRWLGLGSISLIFSVPNRLLFILQEPSISEPRHLSLCCSVSLQSSTMFCQTVLSGKKGKQGSKQRLRRAPCRSHACALHRIAPVAAERCSSVCLRKRNGCMQHEHLPNLPWSLPAL